MNTDIFSELKSNRVFELFYEISSVPRGSGKTKLISDYCENFAKRCGLDYIRDDIGNIIIFKPASAEEKRDAVIIQGHLDMVWEKAENVKFDFETNGIVLLANGDYITAEGTTLGGDDGIAVAMCLALLERNDISHPPLEIVLTVDEETGMEGAVRLDTSALKSKRMINLDSEAEGTLWVSCAGGARVDIKYAAKMKINTFDCYKISVSGFHGGHSGTEINMGYANANHIVFETLETLINNDINFYLVSICGGFADNAITRKSEFVISSDEKIENINKAVYRAFKKVTEKYEAVEKDIKIEIDACEKSCCCFTEASFKRFVGLLNDLPNGVISMSKDIEGLVETSLNIGKIVTDEDAVCLTYSVRSGSDSEKEKLLAELKCISDGYNARFEVRKPYPAWEYKKSSALQDIMRETYSEMYNKEMKITAVHAGLECGIFCGKIDKLDCVSLGPDIFDIHSPLERLSISSVERVWCYILKVLEKL